MYTIYILVISVANIYNYIYIYTCYTYLVNSWYPPSATAPRIEHGAPVPETPFGAACARRCSHSLSPANTWSRLPHEPSLEGRGRNGPEAFRGENQLGKPQNGWL